LRLKGALMKFRQAVICPIALLVCYSVITSAVAATKGGRATRKEHSVTPPQAPRDEALWKKALELQRKSIVVDTHNDVLSFMTDEDYDLGVSSVGKYHTDIARMKQGGL